MPLPSSPDRPSVSSTASGWVAFLTNAPSLTPHFFMLQSTAHPRISLSPKGKGRERHSGCWGSAVCSHRSPRVFTALAWGSEALSALLAPRVLLSGWAFPGHSDLASQQQNCRCGCGPLSLYAFLWGFFSPHTWSFSLLFPHLTENAL